MLYQFLIIVVISFIGEMLNHFIPLPIPASIYGIVITFHFVCFCWIFFRNIDFANSMAMISQIIHQFHPEVALQWAVGYWQVLAMMAVGYVLHFVPASVKSDIRRQMARLPWWAYVVLLVAMAYLVIQFKSAEVQPFIYFQF